MKKFLSATLFAAILLSISASAWCDSPVLYQDPETGQVFTKPAEGRVPVDLSTLTQAPAAQPAPAPEAAAAPAGDYSSQAFKDAVTNAVGEKASNTFPKVKIGGLFYGEYSYDFDHRQTTLDNGHNDPRNKFTLNRGYINVLADMSPEIGARFTSDLTRFSGATGDANKGDWELRVKYAYLDFHNFLKFYPSFEVKMGQYQTAWLDYEEGLWEYRVIDPMLIEKEGFFNSADLGVGLKGKIPAGYGDWQVDVINGEGYHADEANKYKTIQGRLTVCPLPQWDMTKGFQLSAFASTGKADFAHKRDRYIGFVGYKYKDDFFVSGEYDITRGTDSFAANVPAGIQNVEGHGFSALAWGRMPFLKPLRILGRYDRFDHDDDVANSTVHRWYYGVSYDISKNVMFVLDNERTIADQNVNKAKAGNENLLKADVQWTF